MKRTELPVSLAWVVCLLVLVCGWGVSFAEAQQGPVKSWIWIDSSSNSRVLTAGENWEVPVEYHLDPAEDTEPTRLRLVGYGPWIDCPDGEYVERRHHVGYPGMSSTVGVEPGRGRHVFRFQVPPALEQNSILLIAWFEDAAGQRRPWEVRRGGVWFKRSGGYFELETEQPGNLFTYDQPVRVRVRLQEDAPAGAGKALRYRVRGTAGETVARGELSLDGHRAGDVLPIELDLQRRGTFLIETEVAGWESRHTTFCRIPDVMQITGGAPTRFGSTNIIGPGPDARVEELCRVARRLGLTSCRIMTGWRGKEPGPGVYRLDAWDHALDIAADNGIEPWFCIYNPPMWALRGVESAPSFQAVRVDWDAWRDFVDTFTRRMKGRFYGWEWLNEITPGGTPDPVRDYLKFCRIGTETAKAVAPDLKTILAGGLWPRSFRTEMLKAGVGQYVDVLPVHYANGEGVRQARRDLQSVGFDDVEVWDDESASCTNAWKVPPIEDLRKISQAQWVLRRWTDELSAGCKRIIYFGGGGSAAGNWSYLMADHSPRPVAATLAVFTSKMFGARPLGVFARSEGSVFHLFEKDGRALLVCFSRSGTVRAELPVGADRVRLVDYQGNAESLDTPGGIAELELKSLPFFLEGADLEVLKACAVPRVLPRAGAEGQPAGTPKVTMLRGGEEQVFARLHNLYDQTLSGTLTPEVPAEWPKPKSLRFSLAPGARETFSLGVAVPADAALKDADAAVRVSYDRTGLPAVRKRLVLSVLSPEMLGNLIRNGGFEEPDASGRGPAEWNVNGETSRWVEAPDDAPGLGKRVIKYAQSEGYVSTGQTLDLRGGRTYLYTAWLWNQDMHAGSNVYLTMEDGTTRSLYDTRVFTAGENSPWWQMYAAHIDTPSDLKQANFAPFGRGPGRVLLDNVRVTPYRGTDFVAECHRTEEPPVIDGRLDEWPERSPIPLIGRNQLTVVDDAYQWGPENLNGAARLMWDDENLYLALEVRDDRHHPVGGDETVTDGDSLILAIDPTNRGTRAERESFAYYVSTADPGGGSGGHTIFRPEARSGGLRAGHLLRDSSIHEMAVRTENGRTTYELRLRLSDMGGIVAAEGRQVGLSLQLNDSDGQGAAAHMNWGDGLSPEWRPGKFGLLTFVR
ncbi:MAG: sugar-binding protein [Planctomycetota bacterium]